MFGTSWDASLKTDFFSALPIGIRKVSTTDVQTREGREGYLRFLKDNPKIRPLQKLFGLDAPFSSEPSAIIKHYKELAKWIHPDKVGTDEKTLCTELFQLVKGAVEECGVSQHEIDTFISALFSSYSSDPFVRLATLVRDEFWEDALACVEQHQPTSIHDHHFSLLCIIVFLRFGKINEAIACVRSHYFALEILSLWQQALNATYIEQRKFLLLEALTKVDQLTNIIEKDLIQKVQPLPKHIVTYKLYSSLKDCFKDNNPSEYEKYLRLAIRYCPNGIEKEKRDLVHELHDWVVSSKFVIGSNVPREDRVKFEGTKLCREFITQLSKMKLKEHFEINNCIQLFCHSMNIEYLIRVINLIANITQRRYPLSNHIPSFLKGGVDYFVTYSQKVMEELTSLLNPIIGLKLFLKNEKREALSYLPKDSIIYGFALQDLGEYYEAINTWGRLIEKQRDQYEFFNYIRQAMNANDMPAYFLEPKTTFSMDTKSVVPHLEQGYRINSKLTQLHPLEENIPRQIQLKQVLLTISSHVPTTGGWFSDLSNGCQTITQGNGITVIKYEVLSVPPTNREIGKFTIGSNLPNKQTLITCMSIVLNTFCQVLKDSVPKTHLLNLPVRSISLSMAVYNKRIYKVACEVAAITALFFPYAPLTAIGIDIISEAVNYYQSRYYPKREEDQKQLLGYAYSYLGLEKTASLKKVNYEYSLISTALEEVDNRFQYPNDEVKLIRQKAAEAYHIILNELGFLMKWAEMRMTR